MELESLAARVSQLEKDLAECRAKVFLMEAINVEQSKRQTFSRPFEPSDIPGYDQFSSGGEDSVPTRRLSPFSLPPIGTPPEETAVGAELQVNNEEMFDVDY